MDATTKYAKQIVAQKIPSCKYVMQACKRHLNDMDNGGERGLYFNVDAAEIATDFFSLLTHTKGEWAGHSFQLELWQAFIVGSIFGWMRDDGFRRFRMVYVEVPRKNGKSTLAAGIGLKMMEFDNEAGAEVYSAATKRDQARIVWGAARDMVKKNSYLANRVKAHQNNLHSLHTASKFEPLSADIKSLDGLNVHCGIIDELHAHKTREIFDVIETATGARRQPLLFTITTAGFNKAGICYEQRQYAQSVLDGRLDDDSYFGIIYTIDDGDDWTDPDCWAKANPNYGVSVLEDDIARLARKAKEIPAAQNNFLTKRLNVWTMQETLWLDVDKWKCLGNEELNVADFVGCKCYAGLDLASVSDICALSLIFPKDDGTRTVFCKYYLPQEAVDARSIRANVPYDTWAEAGLFTLTDGNATDYNYIQRDIKEICDDFRVAEIAYDRWNSSQLVNNLMEDGAPMIPFGQGFASMSAPMKELERLIIAKQIDHNCDPVLSWMVGNVAIKQDEAGNIKPAKNKSQEKIDGVVAVIMALGRLMVHEDVDATSVYEDRGFLTL